MLDADQADTIGAGAVYALGYGELADDLSVAEAAVDEGDGAGVADDGAARPGDDDAVTLPAEI